MNAFCLVYGLHGVRCLFQGSCYTVYPLVFNCRGGGWHVMCVKSVAVTSLCAIFCVDSDLAFPIICLLSLFHHVINSFKVVILATMTKTQVSE